MSELTDWKNLHKSESWGSYGTFGLKIEVAGTHLPVDLNQKEIRHAIYDAERKLETVIRRAAVMEDPAQIMRRAEERAELLGLFGGQKIFVEDLPNGYMVDDWFFSTRPWFMVTTTKGRIKIGWRKSVINISWEDNPSLGDGDVIFKDEQVTTGRTLVHAWNPEKAKEYIERLLGDSV